MLEIAGAIMYAYILVYGDRELVSVGLEYEERQGA